MDKYMVVLFAIITGIIGMAILDSVIATTVTPGTINETIGTANATGYLSGTLTYTPLSTPLVYANGTAETVNVTVATGSKSLTTNPNSANFGSAEVKSYYSYDDATYLSGSLSRTIIVYIVPLGLLAILGLAAYMAVAKG